TAPPGGPDRRDAVDTGRLLGSVAHRHRDRPAVDPTREHRHAPFPEDRRGVNRAGIDRRALVAECADAGGLELDDLGAGRDADDLELRRRRIRAELTRRPHEPRLAQPAARPERRALEWRPPEPE